MADKIKYIGTGKRKSSIARVSMSSPGKGSIVINGKSINDYIPRDSLITIIKEPLVAVDNESSYDIIVNVNGGGLSGQAGAVRLGLSKKLEQINPASRIVLKKAGMLTRDARVVERKKPGQPGARKKFQFSKR